MNGLNDVEPACQRGEVLLKHFALRRAAGRQQAAQRACQTGLLLQEVPEFRHRQSQLGGGCLAIKGSLETLRDQIDRLLIGIAKAKRGEGLQVSDILRVVP